MLQGYGEKNMFKAKEFASGRKLKLLAQLYDIEYPYMKFEFNPTNGLGVMSGTNTHTYTVTLVNI